MRKLYVFVLIVVAAAAYGEDAAVITERRLRLSLNQSLGAVDGKFLAATGIGVEYGVTDWLNLQFFWNPGIKYKPDFDLSSLFAGVKVYILGDSGALAPKTKKVRLSAALGMTAPLSKEPDLMDQDQMLWGSALRLYSDFIFSPYVYLNLYFEGIFYPPQHTDNNVFYGNWVEHYLDMTWELEMHAIAPLKNGVKLKFGAPVRFFYAPFMNKADEYATNQYCLSVGGYFCVETPGRHPVEIYLKYNGHILGQNIKQVHRGGIVIKVNIDTRPGDKAAIKED